MGFTHGNRKAKKKYGKRCKNAGQLVPLITGARMGWKSGHGSKKNRASESPPGYF